MIKERTEAGETIEIPLSFGQYNYLRTIGRGNYSVVVLVSNSSIQQQFACKIMTRSLLQADDTMQRFMQEIEILKAVRHPYIVSINEILYTQTNVYIVMEYCNNGELFTYIVNHPNMSRDTIQRFFFQVVSAISFLHQKRIAHRDIKAENILLDDEYNVKLADFGFSKKCDENFLMKTPCGSPYYASPEIIKGSEYDGQKSDIWSIGVLLFALCTGAMPWTAQSQTGLYTQIINAQFEIPVYVDRDIADIITICLALDPDIRPTANELLQCDFLKGLTDKEKEKLKKDENGKFKTSSMVCRSNSKNQIFKANVARSVIYSNRLRKGIRRNGVRNSKAPRLVIPTGTHTLF